MCIEMNCKHTHPSSKLMAQFVVEVNSQHNHLCFPDISRNVTVFHLVNELYPQVNLEYHPLLKNMSI